MQKIVDDGNSAGRVLDLDSQSCGVFDSQAIFSQAQRAKNASSWFTLSWMVFTPLQCKMSSFRRVGKIGLSIE